MAEAIKVYFEPLGPSGFLIFAEHSLFFLF
jgi:hypothetical protein